ncbi:MAG: hypothetical protein J6T16_05795 [Opitutales bacterium]|nr:hypothetical protein [Opitutales bacterium]
MRELESFSASSPAFCSASVKIFAALVFIVCVVSFGVYDARVCLFFIYPVALFFIVRPPSRLFFSRALIVLPFVLFAGISNIIFDSSAARLPFGIEMRGGIVSFFTLLMKAFLCAGAVLFLVLTTPVNAIAGGLRRFKMPCVLVLQIVLTLRYLEVLLEEASRMGGAYALRAPASRGVHFKDWPKIVARLFLRSLDRAQRIYEAMLCRGFCARKSMDFFKTRETAAEIFFLAVFSASCVFLRVFNWQFQDFIRW